MAQIKFTKKNIDRLPKTEKPRGERYYDTELHCFGLVSYPTGRKSFFIEYGDRGHRRRMTLGAYGRLTPDQARELAKQKMAAVSKGEDPLDEREDRRNALTFGAWADAYLEKVKSRKKHPREDVRYLGMAKTHWGTRPLSSISADDIEKVQDILLANGTKIASNRWLASIRACLQDAWRLGKIESNPAMKAKAYPENDPRARVLNDVEFIRLIEAIHSLEEAERFDRSVYAAFFLLVETGARMSEVLHAKWEDMDLDQGLWRIPRPKSGRAQVQPLSPNTVALLAQLPKLSIHVIPGRKQDRPRSDLQKPWAFIKEKAKLKGVTIHDIRRTFGLQVAKSAGLHVASKLLRHSDIRVTERHYAPLGIDELREALVEREKVLPMRKKTAKGKA